MRIYDSIPWSDVAALIKSVFERPQAFSPGTLAAKATGDPDLKTTSTITYKINNILYTKGATATIDLSATSDGGKVQAAGTYAAYLVTLDASGNFNCYKGDDAASAALAYAALPAPPSGECPVGILLVTNTTNAFVLGTTNSNATGVTFTCTDLCDIPPGYGAGALYKDTISE